MSALTDLFTAMANKIRSKTGTATTYTPSEMASDGIDDVYDAGVASVPTPTSITPSNSSPVSLTANTAVKPTASGYAIESYSSVIPSNAEPKNLTSGSIYKVVGNGKAIESCSSITPSDASPVTLSSGGIYKMRGNGKAVASVTTLSPSNSYPQRLGGSTPYIGYGSALDIIGYAIESYTSKTPSDSNPPSVSSGDIVKMGGAGYLVENAPIDMSNPDVTWEGNLASNGSKTIAVTQKPRLVISSTSRYGDNNGYFVFRVNDVANDKNCNAYYGASGYVENLNGSGLTSITVSDTSVVYNSNRSYTTRNAVFIWY